MVVVMVSMSMRVCPHLLRFPHRANSCRSVRESRVASLVSNERPL